MQDFTFQMNYDEQSYTAMRYSGDEPDVEIPPFYAGKPVTILYDDLFAGHAEVRSIRFPDTITDFGEFLFDGCTELKRMELPRSLQFLWGYTFARSALEEIVLPEGVTTIPPYAFKDCKALERVVCGSKMRRIHAWAFGGCDRLADLVCGPDVEISPDAFRTNPNILRLERVQRGH